MYAETSDMKLFWSATSPFARKVTVTARELGVEGRIEIIPTVTANEPEKLLTANPCGKLPVLLADGMVIPESSLICEYIDVVHGGGQLLPSGGSDRWRELALAAQADSAIDAALLIRFERMRPKAQRSSAWEAKQMRKLTRSLDRFEEVVPGFGSAFSFGQIALACGLGYLELRFADDALLADRPALARWLSTVSQRPSMLATRPPAD